MTAEMAIHIENITGDASKGQASPEEPAAKINTNHSSEVFIPLDEVLYASSGLEPRTPHIPDFLKTASNRGNEKNGLTKQDTLPGAEIFYTVSEVEQSLRTQFTYEGREVPASSQSPSFTKAEIDVDEGTRWSAEAQGYSRILRGGTTGEEIGTNIRLQRKGPDGEIVDLTAVAPFSPKEFATSDITVVRIDESGVSRKAGLAALADAQALAHDFASLNGDVRRVDNPITSPGKQLVFERKAGEKVIPKVTPNPDKGISPVRRPLKRPMF